MDSPTALRVAGWLAVLGPLAYVSTWALAGAVTPGYSAGSDAISELAAIGAPTATAMNSAFIAFGVAGIPISLAVRRVLPGAGAPLTWAMALCSIATIGAGFFPCSPGCPGAGSSLTDNGHAVTATVGYLALMASPILAGRATWSHPGWRAYAGWSYAAGALGIVGLAVWASGAAGDWGGGLQRLFNTLADVWWVGTAIIVLRRAGDAGRGAGPVPRDQL